jgi:mRNA interferase MazF
MPLFRLPVQPSKHNGLKVPCQIMVDKITTVSRSKLGKRIGQLGDEDLLQLNRSVLVFLGIAG